MGRIGRRGGMASAMLLALLCLGVGRANGQVTPAAPYTPPDDTQAIKLGAVIYYDYTTTRQPKTTDAEGNTVTPSAFNVSRSYINITGNISHAVAFRLTPDITRVTDTGALNGNLVFRIKYAFAQVNLEDWTGGWKGTWVRLGIQQTPYLDYAENIYRYRFQGTMFVEREAIGGNLTSSDAGVSFHTSLPGNAGEFHAGFYNGDGYSKQEANDQKAIQVRGTVRPFARSSHLAARGLRVTLFYDADHYLKNGERTRLVANATFEHRRVNAGFDFLDGADRATTASAALESRGWSLWVTPFAKEKGDGFEGLVRVDRFRPSAAFPSQHKQRVIAGVAYWFPHPGGSATAAILFDVDRTTFDGFSATPATATQERIAVHGLISF